MNDLEALVSRARDGDATALEGVVLAIQGRVHSLALHMLWHPEDARDATQEILIRVVTHLGTFRGESSFRTWVDRVACNHLRTMRRARMERMELTFDAFAEDLAEGLAEPGDAVEDALLLEEVRVGCTLGMLLCLNRDLRLAYILGDILELDGVEASAVLDVTPAAFRQRLSRARSSIVDFTRRHCGLTNPENACRCSRRVSRARELGRVDADHLLFAHDAQRARRFPELLEEIRALDQSRRAVALYRSHGAEQEGVESFVRELLTRVSSAR